MLGNLNDYVEVPQEEYFKIDHDIDQDTEISDNCQKMMSRLQKELNKKDKIGFKKLTQGQSKATKCQSFLELLHLKRKDLIDLRKYLVICFFYLNDFSN